LKFEVFLNIFTALSLVGAYFLFSQELAL